MDDWKLKQLWHRRGDNFLVEIDHHTVEGSEEYREGTNRWCVYAYIYPAHPQFNKFSGDSLFQEATNELPLHGGASYLHVHRDSNCSVTCIQVGADYHHDGDRHHTFNSSPEKAATVFYDADKLFDWLKGSDK